MFEEYKGFTNEELCFLAQNGNEEARKYLIEKNDKFIKMFLRKYTKNQYTQEFDDLYGEACIGFIQAIDRFDTTKGFKFNTYAGQYIDGAIKLALRNSYDGKCFRVGRDQRYAYVKASKMADDLAQKLGRTPTLEETAKAMEMDIKQLSDIITLNKEHAFLHDVKWDSQKSSEDDILMIESIENPKNKTENETVRDIIINDAVSKLSPKRQFILKKLYWEQYTQAEVAEMLGVTQCLVSREKRMAIKLLKNILTKELNKPEAKRNYEDKECSMKIRCVTTGEEFASIRDAERKYGVYHGGISRAVNGKMHTAGKHPKTQESLVWEKVI